MKRKVGKMTYFKFDKTVLHKKTRTHTSDESYSVNRAPLCLRSIILMFRMISPFCDS